MRNLNRENPTDKSLSSDLNDFLCRLKKSLGGIFSPGREIFITRAPGRLEILGGLAEKAGCMVLQQTVQQGTIVAAQKRTDGRILIRHLNLDPERMITAEYHLDELFPHTSLKSFARRFHERNHREAMIWPLHIVGLLAVLLTKSYIKAIPAGFNLAIESSLPVGRGIGSSAALQMACLLALKEVYPFEANESQMSEICQALETEILRRPGGKTAALISTSGQKNKMMVCLCQPMETTHREIWPGLQWAGFDSAVERPADGDHYIDYQAGLSLASRLLSQTLAKKGLAAPQGGYLANITPEEWQNHLREQIPFRLSGREAKEQLHAPLEYREFIDPEKRYALRNYCEFAIAENDRSLRLLNLLESVRSTGDRTRLIEAGEILYQSHQDLGRLCGLRHKKTDLIVEMVRTLGPENGFYGARSSSGGEGGVVTVLLARGYEDAMKNLAAQYAAQTGLTPAILTGSADGALTTGVLAFDFI